jgi:putative resolvase
MNNINHKQFYSGKDASEILGLTQNTLRQYADNGYIDIIKTVGNQRRYDIRSYIGNSDSKIRRKVCYCRVSTHKQKENLITQVAFMKQKYPGFELITDIGSGINFQRPGLIKIMDYAISGQLAILVVAHKDRLCRIGYSMIDHILSTYSNTHIIVEMSKKETENEEMANDILQIITVYSAKIHGLRRYKKTYESI